MDGSQLSLYVRSGKYDFAKRSDPTYKEPTEPGWRTRHHSEAFALAKERGASPSITGLWIIDTRWQDLIGDEWLLRESVRQRFYSYLVSQQRDEGEVALRDFMRRAGEAGLAAGASILSGAGDPAEVVRRLSADCDLVLLPEGGGREVRRIERASLAEVVRLEARRETTTSGRQP